MTVSKKINNFIIFIYMEFYSKHALPPVQILQGERSCISIPPSFLSCLSVQKDLQSDESDLKVNYLTLANF